MKRKWEQEERKRLQFWSIRERPSRRSLRACRSPGETLTELTSASARPCKNKLLLLLWQRQRQGIELRKNGIIFVVVEFKIFGGIFLFFIFNYETWWRGLLACLFALICLLLPWHLALPADQSKRSASTLDANATCFAFLFATWHENGKTNNILFGILTYYFFI